MMPDMICPFLLASKRREDPKEHALCIKENGAWWFFKALTATGLKYPGNAVCS